MKKSEAIGALAVSDGREGGQALGSICVNWLEE
jgi:hypothetical protein